MNFLQLLEEQLRQQRPAFQPSYESLLDPRPAATMSEYSPETFTPNAEGLSLLSRVGLGFMPGAGVGDFLGQFPDAEGGLEPSALENWAAGNYGTTVLQSLGAAGDVAMLVPGLGLLGAIAKAPRATQIATRATRSSPEGLLDLNKQIDNLKSETTRLRQIYEESPTSANLQKYIDSNETYMAARDQRAVIKSEMPRESGLLDVAPTEYRMTHTAPTRESGAPLSALDQVYPSDVYSPSAVQFYGTGDATRDRAIFKKVQSFRNKPDAEVTIYRAVPKDLPPDTKINQGDWVTIDRQYARDHGEMALDGNYRIIEDKVKAGDLFTNGDSIYEFGFDPNVRGLVPAYHGTSPSAARAIEKDGFDLSMSADGSVWLTSNPNIGEVAATGKGGVVKRMIDENNLKLGGWEEADRYLNDELIQMGYDGLKLVDDGEITYQIFNPQKLIKP